MSPFGRLTARQLANTRILFVGLAAMLAPATSVSTPVYPAHPIVFVVPFAAGGPSDALARLFADRMAITLGQPVLVEDVAGAAGSMGVGRVARAMADGYTVSLGHWATHVINGAVYDLPYDLVNDLEPVARLPANPMLIVSRKDLPAGNLKELVSWIRINNGRILVGTAGAGSASHIAGLDLENITGSRFTFVPYRGVGPAMVDLVAGRIDLMVDQAANSMVQMRGGAIKAYAVTAEQRLAAASELPTVDEAGIAGFHISVWYGLWVPRATPKDVVATLNAAAKGVMADPAIRARLADMGLDVPPADQQTPEALRRLQKAEIEKWWPIVRAARIRPD